MSKSGGGPLGFNQTPNISAFAHIFRNFAQNMRVGAPTTASTIAAAAHDFNLNIGWGLAAVGGEIKEFDDQADFDLSNSGSAAPSDLPVGSSVVYSIVLLKSDVVRMRVFRGAPAVTGSELAQTKEEIAAKLGSEVEWFEIGRTTINRTGTATLTQTYINDCRPMLVYELS
jgi:hypothetical protein